MLDQKLTSKFPTTSGRVSPCRDEAKARFVYLIKRDDGMIKVGISNHVRRRRSQLAQASPNKLSILKTVRSSGGLVFQRPAEKRAQDYFPRRLWLLGGGG